MDRIKTFSNLVIGFIIGYSFGLTGRDAMSAITFVLTMIGFMVVGALLMRFDKANQERQAKSWETARARGKWFFVIFRYFVARACLLLVLIFLPIFLNLGLTRPLLVMLAFSTLLLGAILAYIGHQEWQKNELAFHSDPIVKAARARIAQTE